LRNVSICEENENQSAVQFSSGHGTGANARERTPAIAKGHATFYSTNGDANVSSGAVARGKSFEGDRQAWATGEEHHGEEKDEETRGEAACETERTAAGVAVEPLAQRETETHTRSLPPARHWPKGESDLTREWLEPLAQRETETHTRSLPPARHWPKGESDLTREWLFSRSIVTDRRRNSARSPGTASCTNVAGESCRASRSRSCGRLLDFRSTWRWDRTHSSCPSIRKRDE